VEAYPELREITCFCRGDQSLQPALVCPAAGDGKRPLAVCLHTWSYGIENHDEHFAELCRQRNWHFIFPLFRGPNDRPEACGSDLVVSDLESAVEYMRQTYPVNGDRNLNGTAVKAKISKD